ncbi:hypothetical protein CRE_28794 [Caenorhabditis remanei]|uniref:Uncharacterized protein n=1 Tax=Caenorhabditis remanei TaxID=31234 RepID=E3MK40_CAERE|nr:hypothetical protein CRE_28794 [Caenorhabditis remanei]
MKVCFLFFLICSSHAYLQIQNSTNQPQIKKKSNHQGRFLLKNINEARRILASGLLNNVKDLLGLDLPSLGPAGNMYRMKWSRHLEEMAEKNLAELDLTPESVLYGNKNIEGYRGFYWLYDISDVVGKFLEKHDIPDFLGIIDILKKFNTVIQALIFIIWGFSQFFNMSGKFPDITFNIEDNSGPLDVFFADRYEFGCAFNEYAICFVRDGQRKLLYKKGVPCTQCPTFCEFIENIDGTIDEGDMCVPPTTSKLAPAPMPEFEFDSSSQLNVLFVFLIMSVFLLKYR